MKSYSTVRFGAEVQGSLQHNKRCLLDMEKQQQQETKKLQGTKHNWKKLKYTLNEWRNKKLS